MNNCRWDIKDKNLYNLSLWSEFSVIIRSHCIKNSYF